MDDVIVVGGIKLDERLGEGAFSQVRRGIDLQTGKKYAVKIISRQNLEDQTVNKQIIREIGIMQSMNHPNLIHLYKVMRSSDFMYLVLELAEGGELFSKIAATGPLPEDQARRYFQQLIDALDYMHKHKAIHRDLKPENILFDLEDNLKITDFGLSIMSNTKSGQPDRLKTRCGTPNYVAPEIFDPRGYLGEPADIWGAGMILYVMFTAILPFDADSVQEIVNMVCHGRLEMPESIPRPVQHLLMKILVRDPRKRFTIEQIREDPWFKIGYTQVIPPEDNTIKSSDPIDVEELTMDEYMASSSTPDINAFELIGTISGIDLRPIIDSKGEKITESFTFKRPLDEAKAKINDMLNAQSATISKVNSNTTRVLVVGQTAPISFTYTLIHVMGTVNLFQMNLLRGDKEDFVRLFSQFHKQFTY